MINNTYPSLEECSTCVYGWQFFDQLCNRCKEHSQSVNRECIVHWENIEKEEDIAKKNEWIEENRRWLLPRSRALRSFHSLREDEIIDIVEWQKIYSFIARSNNSIENVEEEDRVRFQKFLMNQQYIHSLPNAQVDDDIQQMLDYLVDNHWESESEFFIEDAIPEDANPNPNPVLIRVKPGIECPLCYEDTLFEDTVNTECNHSFCYHCVIQMMKKKEDAGCPLCRRPIEEIFTHSAQVCKQMSAELLL